jgi:prepilin-type N-terminal cleavage/methylation domain-containing protein
MYPNKKAFTLIELLVVVLIIGILAAIALPQYMFAVEKTHYAEAAANLRAIANAQNIYSLSTGNYSTTFTNLDVQLPNSGIVSCAYTQDCIETKNFYYGIHYNPKYNIWILQARRRTNSGNNYETYYYALILSDGTGTLLPNALYCALITSMVSNVSKERAFCKKVSGTATPKPLDGGEYCLMK